MLKEYKKKRSFSKTPEPTGGKPTGKQLIFVIQKHDATRLHYDFRLEMDGVLKSWAVPKGPSLNPADKRLAMMVEDHPYNYRDFEGIIPEGNYGAGTVVVWDQGTYEPLEKAGSKADAQKMLLSELKKGSLKFRLNGEKLKGEFALVHIHGKEENAWLLIKHKDEYATTRDVTKQEKSVVTGRTLHQVETDKGSRQWQSNRSSNTNNKNSANVSGNKPAAATTRRKSADATAPAKGKHPSAKSESSELPAPPPGRKSSMPAHIKPMLATLVEEPFDNKDWLYEIKWDGYRAVAYLNKGKVELESRNNISFNTRFAPVKDALAELGIQAVLDGEIVALNEGGMANFQALQGYLKHGKAVSLVYYVFDILWYQGRDLADLPLTRRKELLATLLPDQEGIVRYSDHIVGKGKEFFAAALDKGLEGIMAKKCDSSYAAGARSQSWLKIKNNRQMEAIIGGFTQPRESRKYFGAVILGVYEGSTLRYIGHSGSGFDQQGLKDLYAKFKPIITKTCPFQPIPKTNMPATWIKPELVCEVKFTEKTEDGYLRHPIFMGLREDKKGSEEKNVKIVKAPVTQKSKPAPAQASDLLAGPDDKEKEITVDRHPLILTNLRKLYWKKEKITKGDMINYYHSIAEYIVPYLKGRPQSMNRHPDGIEGMHFYNKNVADKAPDWIQTLEYAAGEEGKSTRYLVAAGESSLLYMANLGCIEINPWHSLAKSPEKPSWCVIDLDPDETNSFAQVMEVAKLTHEYLESLNVQAYCKTSGSTGIHIYIPLGAKYNYDQSRTLAQLIVSYVHEQLPGFTSLERSPAKRKGMIYLDFLQNRSTQTIAAPYSLRPKPGAPVSMPLHWEELTPKLKIRDFNIYNALDRVRNEGDIFAPVLDKGIDLKKLLDTLEG